MRTFLIILLFAFSSSFAQKSFIVDKKGTKIIIRDELTNIILIDKRISYVINGKSWEKYIKFQDLDYAVIGPSLLKSFHLNQQKKAEVYFVYGEKQDKKLIGVAITVTTTHGTMSISSTYYELYVIDNNENILDQIITRSGKSKEKIENRGQIATMIRKHFSDCPDLMTKLQKYDIADEKNEAILSFFLDTEYINCK
jgi:hypothetical protein